MFNRIALSSLKVVKSQSEETTCFTAKIEFDGVVIATASNDGRGGANFFRAIPGKEFALRECEAWAKSLPAHEAYGRPIPMDLEFAISLLVEEIESAKYYRAEFAKVVNKAGFIENGRLGNFPKVNLKKMSPSEREGLMLHLRGKYPELTFLSEGSESDFELFMSTVK